MRISIVTKFTAAFTLLVLLSVSAGVSALTRFATVTDHYQEIVTTTQPLSKAAQEVETQVYRASAAANTYVLYRNSSYMDEFNAAELAMTEQVALLLSLVTEEEDRERVLRIEDRRVKYAAVTRQAFDLVIAGRQEEAVLLLSTQALPHLRSMTVTAGSLRLRADTDTQEQVLKAEEETATARQQVIAILAVAAVVGLVLGFAMARRVAAPIKLLAGAAAQIAQGDLKIGHLSLNSRDELEDLGSAFNSMTGSLRTMIEQIGRSSQELAGSSEELTASAEQAARATQEIARGAESAASASQTQASYSSDARSAMQQLDAVISQVATGAQEQARVVTDTAAGLHQMRSAARDVAGGAREVSAASVQALASARSGGTAVREGVESIAAVSGAVSASAARVQELGQRSQTIGTIVETITAIAEQTNLLALNAAIEAARAGEHGRGFAVVADEVRSLAERSRQASGEIAGLVRAIQADMTAALDANQKAAAQAGRSAQQAGAAGDALQEILASMEKSAAQMRQIAESAAAMEVLADQASTGMTELASVTEETTASAEEMAATTTEVGARVGSVQDLAAEVSAATQEVSAAAEEVSASMEQVAGSAEALSRMAQELQESVSRFRL